MHAQKLWGQNWVFFWKLPAVLGPKTAKYTATTPEKQPYLAIKGNLLFQVLCPFGAFLHFTFPPSFQQEQWKRRFSPCEYIL